MRYILFILFISLNSYSLTKSEISKVLDNFGEGYYLDAIDEIKKLLRKHPNDKDLHYWQGLSYMKTLQYANADKSFSKAIKLGAKYQDIYYELGQAQYALKKIKSSMKSFTKSIRVKFKSEESMLYIAAILEEQKIDKKAYEYYSRLTRSKQDSIRQTAMYKQSLYKLKMLINSKDRKDKTLNEVLPSLESAYKLDKSSGIAAQILSEINKIKDRYSLNDIKLANGHTFKRKKYDVSVKTSLVYDSNVTQEAEDASTQATNKDSLVQKTSLNADYRWLFFNRWILNPNLSLIHNLYYERNTPSIYENDKYFINPGVSNKIEHLFLGKAATFSFDYVWSYNGKDYNQKKDKMKYAISNKFTIGESVDYFSIGSSTVKFEFEDYIGYSSSLDYDSIKLIVNQLQVLDAKRVLIYYGELGSKNYPITQSSNARHILARIDYAQRDLLKNTRGGAYISMTFTDYTENDSRGMEKTFNPGVSLTRSLWENYRIKGFLGYTKNISKSKDTYQYSQWEAGIEFKVLL